MQACLIYGTGGHARVLADLAALNRLVTTIFFDDVKKEGFFKNVPVRAYDSELMPGSPLMIAIGDNRTRKRLAENITHSFLALTHPSAILSNDVQVGTGTTILAGAVIQADVTIGKHCIINAGCCIDHEAGIGDYVHIAPTAYVGGGAVVEEGAVVGAGAIVMRNARVTAWTEVPPGAVFSS